MWHLKAFLSLLTVRIECFAWNLSVLVCTFQLNIGKILHPPAKRHSFQTAGYDFGTGQCFTEQNLCHISSKPQCRRSCYLGTPHPFNVGKKWKSTANLNVPNHIVHLSLTGYEGSLYKWFWRDGFKRSLESAALNDVIALLPLLLQKYMVPPEE